MEQHSQFQGSRSRLPTVCLIKNVDYESFVSSLEAYNPFQMPPDLEIAELHKKCKILGKRIEPDEVAFSSSGRCELKKEFCPCCCRMIHERYSICHRSSDILNYGLTVPLFFNFIKFNIITIALIGVPAFISLAYLLIMQQDIK